ncbi:MAG: DUF721 domain-containing protein [Verrucomicrobiia bacterium]|jgi:predicted nucleic acid-binding Zn ribbon protein
MSKSLRLDSWTPARRTEKDKILAEWRGVDVMPLALAREDRTRSAEGLMAQVLKGIGLDRKRSEAEVVKVWNNLIDPTITAHAQPNSLHKGTLFVCVDNNVWLSEIVRYRRHEILQRLQHGFGSDVIQRVSYRIG